MRIAITDDRREDSAHLERELQTCLGEMGYGQDTIEVYDSGEALPPGRFASRIRLSGLPLSLRAMILRQRAMP